jgi:hypothetical protein
VDKLEIHPRKMDRLNRSGLRYLEKSEINFGIF